jgi:endonuclease/exonuclease/phosphatase family metal-dependent hydrolase
MRYIALRVLGTAILIAGALLTACTSTGDTAQDAALSETAEPPATAKPAPLMTLKIASYNILFGAGIDRSLDEHIPERFRGIDRSPLLIEYLEQLDADVVGLQETAGWDQGSPPYIEGIARQLGMNYFVSTGRSDSSLLTKLEILEAQDLSTPTTSIVWARLRGPDGEPVNVYVAHLNSDSLEERSCSTEFLLQHMEPYAAQRTFLIGDMNFKAKGATEWGPKVLREGGWQLLAADNRLGLDQIWVPASLQWDSTAWSAAVGGNLSKLSDHSPVGREVMIFSPSGPELTSPNAGPTPMPEMQGLPPEVYAAAANLQVAFVQQPGAPCNLQRWNPDASNANISGTDLHVYGEEDWRSGANWSEYISENEGMLLDFKYEPLSEFNIFLEHDSWGTPAFRKFGMVVGGDGRLRADVWRGPNPAADELWAGTSDNKPDTWYRLLLLAGEGAHLVGFVWNPDAPSEIASYAVEMGADWAGLDWRLSTGGNKGGLDIRSVTQVVFDDLK